MTHDDRAIKTSSKAAFESVENDRRCVILSLKFIIIDKIRREKFVVIIIIC